MDRVRWSSASCRLVVAAALLLIIGCFVGGIGGLVCPSPSDCDRSKCDFHELSSYELEKNCSGGVVRDVCGCCDQCAKVKYEKCGGLHGLSGQCDRGLVCVVLARHGHPITGHEDGQCLEPRDSCASLKNYSGCNLVEGSCLCNVVSACEEPRFDFVRLDDCYKALRMKPVHIHAAKHANCSGVHCGDTMHILCSADSMAVAGDIPPGECCPRPDSSTCRCNPDLCHVPECIADFERVTAKKATGVPGECCDIYECVYIGKNCSSVECSDSRLTCPDDSYALPGVRAEDECCSRPQGCACLPVACNPPTCPAGQRLNMVQVATGRPGSCCGQFRCLRENEKTCVYDSREYVDGSVWNADKCTSCTCKDGLTQCGSVQCLVTSYCSRMEVPEGQCCPVCTGCMSSSGLLHKIGESWKSDECTTCFCNDGKVECQAEMCDLQCTNPRYTPGQCCPQCDEPTVVTAPPDCPPFSCPLSCASGFQIDSKGCFVCQCKLDNCDLFCASGYQSDLSGLPICKCQCPALIDCGDKNCIHGFRLDSDGCQTCRCARCRSLSCSKKCSFGYVRNDRGCRTCTCMDSPEAAIATTDAELYNTTALVTDFTESVPTRSSGNACRTGDGLLHDEGEMWHDGCRNCYCHAGKEMCGLITCPVPTCPRPVIFPKECCPKCLEDAMLPPVVNVSVCQAVDGLHHIEGETWDLDSCTYCICHNGQVLCSDHICPAAPCSEPLRDKDRCCPTCPREAVPPTAGSESLPCSSEDGNLYEDGATWRVGACQSCVCSHGKISCFLDTCPKLHCDKPVLKKDQCCPFCLDTRPAPVCMHEDQVYVSGEMWSVNACIQCVCVDGQTMCKERICSADCTDPVKLPGQCCAVCPGTSSLPYPATSSPGFGCTPKGSDVGNGTWPMVLVHFVLPTTVTFSVLLAVVLFVCFRRRHRKFHFESQKLHNNSVSDVSYSRDKNVFFRNIDCAKKENCNLLPYADGYNKNCDVDVVRKATPTDPNV